MTKRTARSWMMLTPNRVLSALRKLTMLGVLLLCATACRAGTSTWTGSGSTNNWSDANNWSPAGVPPANDDVNLPPLTSDYTVNLDVDVVVGTLTVGGNGAGDKKVTLKQNSHYCIYKKLVTNTSGTVAMTAGGTTELQGSATDSGTFLAGAGSTVKMDAGSTGFNVGPGGVLTFNGEGYTNFMGGVINNDGTMNMAGGVNPLYLYGGGGLVINNNGLFNWTGNSCLHPSQLTPNDFVVMNNVSTGFFFVDCGLNSNTFHCFFNDQGTLNLHSGAIDFLGGGTIGGNLIMAPGTNMTFMQDQYRVVIQRSTDGGATWTNQDANLLIEGNSSTPPITQTGGTLTLTRNAMLQAIGIDEQGGDIDGIGSFRGNFNNSSPGGVNPGNSPGVITINGNYTQNTTGTLNIQLGGTAAGTQYDQLLVTGAATLNGPLNVSLINGFVPHIGNTFHILTYRSHTGSFSARNGLTLPTGNTLLPIFLPHDLMLLTTGPRSIAGRVSDSTGAGVAGVTITRNGTGTPLTTLTDVNGFYSFSGLAVGNYTLRASKAGLVFAPVSFSATVSNVAGVTNANFTATVPNFALSGTVTKGTALLPAVQNGIPNVPVLLVDASNVAAVAALAVNPAFPTTSLPLIMRTRTSASGGYSFSVHPGNYVVLPLLPGIFFGQAYRTVPVTTGPMAGINFIGAGNDVVPPTLTVSSATASGAAGTITDGTAGAGVFTVVATLQNAAHAYLNFAAPATAAVPPQFTALPLLGSYKLTLVPNAGKVPSQTWGLLLPAVLPAGTYTLTVRGIDRAFKLTAPITRTIIKAVALDTAVLSSVTASAATGSVTLRFSTALEADLAADAAHYQVTVNGRVAQVQSAAYNAVAHSVTLGMSSGVLRAGDQVVVDWSGLADANGAALNGQSGAVIAR